MADVEDAEDAELDALIESLAGRLSAASALVSVPDLLAAGPDPLSWPGLYSWWVDEAGSRDLSAGLGLPVRAGLIYLGQAGATRRPRGKRSANTLWNRLVGMHLAGQAEYSTFRRTLAAALRGPLRLPSEDDPYLSQWMRTHLSVIAVPHPDPDSLGLLERAVAHRLEPPVNLAGLPATPGTHPAQRPARNQKPRLTTAVQQDPIGRGVGIRERGRVAFTPRRVEQDWSRRTR